MDRCRQVDSETDTQRDTQTHKHTQRDGIVGVQIEYNLSQTKNRCKSKIQTETMSQSETIALNEDHSTIKNVLQSLMVFPFPSPCSLRPVSSTLHWTNSHRTAAVRFGHAWRARQFPITVCFVPALRAPLVRWPWGHSELPKVYRSKAVPKWVNLEGWNSKPSDNQMKSRRLGLSRKRLCWTTLWFLCDVNNVI